MILAETKELNDLLMEERDAIPEDQDIDTELLALAVLKRLDPRNLTNILIRHAARLELKQMARALCRRWHAEEEDLAENGNLFDFRLQLRYPTADQDNERDIYRTINNLNVVDFDYNIERLESESKRKQLHADALRAERDARVRSGALQAAQKKS